MSITNAESNVVTIMKPKAAYDLLDYGFNYTAWLSGDIIVTSTWVVPSGLTATANSIENDSKAIVWLQEGVAGTTYTVYNRIITNTGRKKETGFVLPVV